MRSLVVLTTVVLLLAACGDQPLGSEGAADDPVAGEWTLVDGVPMVDGYPITLRVEGGEVRGTAACNHYSGGLAIDGDAFAVGDVERTEMGCPEPGVHDSETAYLDALMAVERFEQRGDDLVLLGPDVELRLQPVPAEEDAALAGTDWRLDALRSGSGPDGTASSTMGGASLRLEEGGAFVATDGCNTLEGRWVLDGEALSLSEVSTTDMACPDLAQQAEHVAQVLLGGPTVEVEGRRLLLTAGERGLDYRAVDPGDEQESVSAETERPFGFEGIEYVLSCGVPDPAKVDPAPAGVATSAGAEVEVHRIDGVDPAVLLAVPAEGCDLVEDQQWAILLGRDTGFGSAGITAEANAAWCQAALLPPDPAEGFACAGLRADAP